MNRSHKHWLLALTACLTLSAQVHAQRSPLVFKQISLEHGLSQKTVYVMVQDSVGFLWFGTQDGLNRYDGYGFKIYKNIVSDSASLSDNRVRALYLDRRHTLWIGTSNGLNRYDPQTDSFTRYFHDPGNPKSLSDHDVRAIFEDHTGHLWFGTNYGGLNRFDRATGEFTSFKHIASDSNSLSNDIVLSIVEDSHQNLWVGTLGGGLDKLELRQDQKFEAGAATFKHFTHVPHDPQSLSSNYVMTVFTDRNGTLWVGTYGGGLNKFDSETETFQRFNHDAGNEQSLSSNRVLTIFEDHSGTLWIGTLGGGLNRLVPNEKALGQPLTKPRVANRGLGRDQTHLTSSQSPANGMGAASYRFERHQNNPANPNSFGDNIVRSLYEDRSGNLWIGTNVAGVNKLDLKPRKFRHYRHDPNDANSLNDNNVHAILKDRDGTVWVGTNNVLNKYVHHLDGFKSYVITPKPLTRAQGYIFALCEDQAGSLWIGTYGEGIFKFDKNSERSVAFKHDPDNANGLSNNRVTSIVQDRFGYIWIGTANGLNRLDLKNFAFRHYYSDVNQGNGLSNSEIWVLYEDRSGNLWIGTQNGLNLFDWESESFYSYTNDPNDSNSLSNNAIIAIYQDEAGYLWVGTANGLNKLNPANRRFTHYFEADGLPNEYITGIVGDRKGNLWISSNKGLSRFNPSDTSENSFRNYDLKDGLQNMAFYDGAYHLAWDGELFFGGSNGFNRFYPEEVEDSSFAPPVVFTAFKKLGKDLDSGLFLQGKNGIELTYKENYFTIEFAALDFSYPEKNRYVYRLEGLDHDWIESGTRRFVNYSKVEPGEYVFRVKGTNSDGVWNEAGASLKITITPPFWQTWWFRILAGAAFVGLLALAYNYRVARLLEIERTRNRIAQDLHDEVGATLSSISYFAQAIRSESQAQGMPVSQKFLSLISESSSEAQEAISDIIWAIDPTNDRWDRLLAKFRRYASDLLDSKSIRYDIDIPDSLSISRLDMEQRRNFWLIFKEMVTNTVKHAQCAKVAISISVAGRTVNLTVEDDGVGFDPNQPTDRNGLNNIRARAKKLQAHLHLDTSQGAGTRWHLQFNV